MTTPTGPTPTIDPMADNATNALRLVEILDRGSQEEVVAALKAMLIISRPELAAYATALDIVLNRVAADGRVGSMLSRIPVLGWLFRR